jgi:sugar/nucleoside kinase (ribokinase family)
LEDGRLPKPYPGPVAIDGNLTVELLSEIATSPLFEQADLRVAPASPGKAERLLPFLKAGRGTLYVNLEEAGLLCQSRFETASEAAAALLDRGAARVLVTNGGEPASEGSPSGLITKAPRDVMVTRVTGAGDTFMAAHIVSDMAGASAEDALAHALEAAASYVSGGAPI